MHFALKVYKVWSFIEIAEFTDFHDSGIKYLGNSFIFTAFQASGDNDWFSWFFWFCQECWEKIMIFSDFFRFLQKSWVFFMKFHYFLRNFLKFPAYGGPNPQNILCFFLFQNFPTWVENSSILWSESSQKTITYSRQTTHASHYMRQLL